MRSDLEGWAESTAPYKDAMQAYSEVCFSFLALLFLFLCCLFLFCLFLFCLFLFCLFLFCLFLFCLFLFCLFLFCLFLFCLFLFFVSCLLSLLQARSDVLKVAAAFTSNQAVRDMINFYHEGQHVYRVVTQISLL